MSGAGGRFGEPELHRWTPVKEASGSKTNFDQKDAQKIYKPKKHV